MVLKIRVSAMMLVLVMGAGCEKLTSTMFGVSMLTSTPDLSTSSDTVLAAIGGSAIPAATVAIATWVNWVRYSTPSGCW